MSDNLDAATVINRLESMFIAQITLASIFWFVGLAILNYPWLQGVVYWVFGLTIFLFIITLVDYAQQRQDITNKGIEVPYRLDLIWAAVLVATIVVIWLALKDVSYNSGNKAYI